MEYFHTMPTWQEYLVRGLMLSATLCFAAVIAARSGRTAYWALVMIVPGLQIIAVWAFAYAVWPAEKIKA